MTVVNAFTRRTAGSFPAEPFPFMVLALLTDGLGEGTVDVVISRPDTEENLYRRTASYRFTDPLATVQVTLRVRHFSFPEPGRYQVAVKIDNELFAHRNLQLVLEENES